MNIPYQLITSAPTDKTDEELAAWVVSHSPLIRFIVMEIRSTPLPGAPRKNGRPMINDNLFVAMLQEKIAGEENAVSQRQAAKLIQGISKVSVGGAINVLNRLKSRGILKIGLTEWDNEKRVWAVPVTGVPIRADALGVGTIAQ